MNAVKIFLTIIIIVVIVTAINLVLWLSLKSEVNPKDESDVKIEIEN